MKGKEKIGEMKSVKIFGEPTLLNQFNTPKFDHFNIN